MLACLSAETAIVIGRAAGMPCSSLEALKDAGKIHHYGVSNYDVPMIRECEQYRNLTANQVGYHLFDRRM